MCAPFEWLRCYIQKKRLIFGNKTRKIDEAFSKNSPTIEICLSLIRPEATIQRELMMKNYPHGPKGTLFES